MAKSAKEYVLIHGAAHGAWCWDAVARRLEDKGHRVVAIDLPGHGRRAAEARRATVGAYAAAVADTLAEEGVSRAVLVGHSMAGIVISKAAVLAPARIAHLVYLAAVVLPTGGSMLEDHIMPGARGALRGLAASGGAGTIAFPASMALDRWMGDLSPADPGTARAVAALTPQPFRPLAERVDLRAFYALATPRSYIRCLRDRAVTPAQATLYASRLGVAPVDLDTAHDPMLSAPDDLARILDGIG